MTDHTWTLVFSTVGPGASRDTIEQCRICGVVRHDYEYGDPPQRSPNYPRFFVLGATVVDSGCAR